MKKSFIIAALLLTGVSALAQPQLRKVVFPHPTVSEILKETVQQV